MNSAVPIMNSPVRRIMDSPAPIMDTPRSHG